MNEYPVCLNPSCKSYGKPHPNCKCHAPTAHLAEGGEVEGFCSSHKLHGEKCKYMAEGGEINPPDGDHAGIVSSHLSGGGIHGLFKIDEDEPSESIRKYNQTVKRGHKNIQSHLESLFSGSKHEGVDHTKSRKLISEWIEKGGADHDLMQEMYKQNNPQQFAEGGHVKHEGTSHDVHIAGAYPAQNIMLQEAKGRVSNYLSSLKPQKNQPKLAFDDEPDDRKQKKSYERAIKTAADPTRILKKINDGTIEPEHVAQFKAMFPEIDKSIQEKLMEKITKAQLEGKKPNYKVRQGLSLYLGVPLSGEMSPENMQAAQSVFAAKKPQQPEGGGGAPKKSTSSLTKSDDAFLTSDQARVGRSQKQ